MPSINQICQQHRIALIDAAASEAGLSPELRVHLTNCLSCHEFLESERSLFAAIDGGLRSAANVEVPSLLASRVCAHLEDTPSASPVWKPGWIAVAGAFAVAVIGLFAAGYWRDIGSSKKRTTPYVSEATQAKMLSSPETKSASRAASTHGVSSLVSRSRRPAHVPTEVFQVLVDPGQQVAMSRLLDDLRQGKIDGDALLARSGDPSFDELKTIPLEVAPVEIDALKDSSKELP